MEKINNLGLRKSISIRSIRLSYVQILWYVYIIILAIACAISRISSISNYNAFVILAFDILLIMIHRKSKIFSYFMYLCVLLLFCDVLLKANILYSLIDCGVLFFIYNLIDFSINSKISNKVETQIQNTCALLIILSLLWSFIPNSFIVAEDGSQRYAGLFYAINFSSNIFAIIEICFWEICKRRNCNKWILLYLFISLIIYTDLSGTRSLLFFFPYWLFQFYQIISHKKNGKIVIRIFIIVLCCLIPSIINLLINKLRFQEGESSMATRAVLYQQLIEGILSNYVIIPHGSNSAQMMIVDFTQDERYSPHNNFLSYLYDWGIIFIIILWEITAIIKRKKLIDINMILIMLGVSSCALHNMLLSPYLWIPIGIIIIINNKYLYGKNVVSYSPKIQ